MSPGAQSIGQMCDLLIQKVAQSTEPEACAVYESGRSWVVRTRIPGNKTSHSPRKMATGNPNQDPELDGRLSTKRATCSTSRTHMGSGEGEG